jgi:ABC-type branched-subunit amino acid transport system ATPase component
VTALLRTADVRKAYGGVQALNGATIEVEEGTVAGLIGPNGSGKTTLFNVITGYERADAGDVYFGGKPITNSAPDKVFAVGIGRTFQLTRIFARLTVLENMLVAVQTKKASDRPKNLLARIGKDTWGHHRRRAHELLEFVGIEGHAGLLAGSLSYGQRKLLELAYVLIADPAVILLDEPAGGVNPTLINHIADRIRELNGQGKTFLIVEHNMEFVMGLCSNVTVLESGAAVASGPPDIIRTDKRVLDAYLGADLDEDEDEPESAAAREGDDEHASK